jgi:hypothetical protein
LQGYFSFVEWERGRKEGGVSIALGLLVKEDGEKRSILVL